MKFKEIYVKFNKTYKKINLLSNKIARGIKPKNITDALIIQSIKNSSKFGLSENEFKKIENLSRRYETDSSKIARLIDEYIILKIKLNRFKRKFAKIGIKKIFFGPLNVSGFMKEHPDGIIILIRGKKLEIYENDWNKILPGLTKKINSL